METASIVGLFLMGIAALILCNQEDARVEKGHIPNKRVVVAMVVLFFVGVILVTPEVATLNLD